MFAASDAKDKLYSVASEVQIEEDWSESTTKKEYQKMEGKLKKISTADILGSNWGDIDQRLRREDRGANM